MAEKLTENQLKYALAKALPDKIFMCGDKPHWKATVDAPGYFVFETEWPTIVRLVEDRLNAEAFAKAVFQRTKLCDSLYWDDEPKLRAFDKWQIQAQSLVDVGAISV